MQHYAATFNPLGKTVDIYTQSNSMLQHTGAASLSVDSG